eukprot:15296-Pyramimonas_sp.AAC.1
MPQQRESHSTFMHSMFGLSGARSTSHDLSGAMRSLFEGTERLSTPGVFWLYGRACAQGASAMEPVLCCTCSCGVWRHRVCWQKTCGGQFSRVPGFAIHCFVLLLFRELAWEWNQ